jgi:hypothetical protein
VKTMKVRWIALMAAIGISLLALIVLAQEKKDLGKEFPGNWSIGSSPYVGEDYKTLPVITTGVINDIKKGGGITAVDLKNTTAKTVSAVKFTWYILEEQSPDKVLLQGQTQLIAIPDGILPGKERRLDFPVIVFSRVAPSLVKYGSLIGNFNIEALVSEVTYEDGSSWERTEKGRLVSASSQPNFIKASAKNQTPPCCTFSHCVWSNLQNKFTCPRVPNRLNCQPDQFGGQFQCLTSVCPDQCGL